MYFGVSIHVLFLSFSVPRCSQQYVKKNKEEDNDWFKLECNKEGTR
jgi:hypothetical protein